MLLLLSEESVHEDELEELETYSEDYWADFEREEWEAWQQSSFGGGWGTN